MLEESGGELGDVMEYEAYPEIYADLANGRVDYVINSIVPVNDLIRERPDVFEAGQAVSGPGYVAWLMPKDSPELLTYITDFMSHLRDSGRLAELQEKWFGESFDDLPTTLSPRWKSSTKWLVCKPSPSPAAQPGRQFLYSELG